MRKLLVMLFLLSPAIVFAQDSNLSEGYSVMTQSCEDIDCVQNNIQIIDGQIASLVAKRLAYVKRGAELKNKDVRLPKEPGGYTDTRQDIGVEAKQMGSSPAAAQGVLKAIDQQSNAYEEQFLKKKGQPGDRPERPIPAQPLRQLEQAYRHPHQQPR